MPYVQRDASGRVSALFEQSSPSAMELLAGDHPDVVSFLAGILPQKSRKNSTPELTETDLGLIRVIEDLIDILIDKNILMFTDLPPEAREKIMFRKSTREKLSAPTGLMVDEDKIF